MTCLYHCSLFSCMFVIFLLLLLSVWTFHFVTYHTLSPHTSTSTFSSCYIFFFSYVFLIGHVSAPYNIASLTIVLYALPLIFALILLPHKTPEVFFHFPQPDIIKLYIFILYQLRFWWRKFFNYLFFHFFLNYLFFYFLGLCWRAHGCAQNVLWYVKGTIPLIIFTENGVLKCYISWTIFVFSLKLTKLGQFDLEM
jgi:hypothetical protein